jgi:hypothetical protein
MSILTLKDTEGNADGEGKKVFEPLPLGLIAEAEILEVTEAETTWLKDEKDPSKGNQSQVSFRFKIVDSRYPEYEGRNIWGNTPTTFSNHPDCKLRAWVEEILDAGMDELAPGFQLNLDDLMGRNVRVVVGHRKTSGKDFVEGVIRVKRVEPLSF